VAVIFDGFSHQVPDVDPVETDEWISSFDAVVETQGKQRARYLLMRLLERAQATQVGFPATVSTPYLNTIPADEEPWFPGDEAIERRIRAYLRWNAVAMVVRANHKAEGIGGHLATYASAASLMEVGFNHFFRGHDDGGIGDQVFFQGHASPGVYARAYLEGRLDEEDLDRFRFEVDGPTVSEETGGRGLSSYPHPHLMPRFWQFPTVSMGLGPLNAIYQARFNRYLFHREILDTSRCHVWCFVGDGEVDEPETLAAISLAAREGLDNLTFVVNCNLQRLDGPVRGNGKIIQELEASFRGAGWNVIKVIWGSKWDELLHRDVDGVLVNKMNSTVDGEFQKYATESGAYIRENFFGPDPRLRKMVEHLSDEELQNLPRGGHDLRKIYAAYAAALDHKGAPSAILAKTIKGWKLGPDVQARNATHQIKKMTREQLIELRDRLGLTEEIPDEAFQGDDPPYCRPAVGSLVHEYLMARRKVLGGAVPKRNTRTALLPLPRPETFAEFLGGSGQQAASTTMVMSKLLRNLIRDPGIGRRVVPIVPDEARTFGLDALFREAMIYSPTGQLYEPVDAGLLLSYVESTKGQILEEGITEAGSMASFTAAATAYATLGHAMVPFFIYYSMFGFQRVGDLIWAAADAGARGFLLGATAGRTTLTGEGLQHCDGHSHVLASVVPNLRAYDPAFAYEVATIIEDGISRMYGPAPEECFYYLTLYNENYLHPPMEEGVREGIIRGIYRFAPPAEVPGNGEAPRATILFSGTAWSAAMEARTLLANRWGVSAECWSVTSYKALREDALSVERSNRLHPSRPEEVPFVTSELSRAEGPVIAVTDFMKAVPDQISRFVPAPAFVPLGTDGFGRSDTRQALRRHFEVDAAHVCTAVLWALARLGSIKPETAENAIEELGIDPDAPNPSLL
jgi:pyruvate dehydrogenase E1 component